MNTGAPYSTSGATSVTKNREPHTPEISDNLGISGILIFSRNSDNSEFSEYSDYSESSEPSDYSPVPPKHKKPPCNILHGGSRSKKDGGDLLSRLAGSTIGAGGLNFSVRNGKRWIPAAIAA